MNRIDRLFGILVLLQSRKYTSAEYIAEHYKTSVRTVYRDLKALGDQGVPVTFEPNRGYCIVQGYFLPPVAFSSDEANALLLMESIISGFADKSIQKHYSSALLKVKNVLKYSQKEQVEHLTKNIRFQVPERIKNNYEHLSAIQHAITCKQIIEIEYNNQKDETSRRQVEPIGLIFYAFAWHLIGWCHKRATYRDFKVARIVELKQTDIPFTITDHMEVNAYMKELPVSW